jgi:type II secretory pathway pseudopilin PulG
MNKSAYSNETGFSLIELLFVFLMIGIIAATAIPAFKTFKAQAGDIAAEADLVHMAKAVYGETSEEGSNPWCLMTNKTGPSKIAPSVGCPDLNLTLSPRVVLDYIFSFPLGNEQILVMMTHHQSGQFNHLWWDILGTRQHQKQPRS